MKLPRPRPVYDSQDEAQTRALIEQADGQNLKLGVDVDLRRQRVVARSPDGNLWSLGVSNSGTTTWTPLL